MYFHKKQLPPTEVTLIVRLYIFRQCFAYDVLLLCVEDQNPLPADTKAPPPAIDTIGEPARLEQQSVRVGPATMDVHISNDISQCSMTYLIY